MPEFTYAKGRVAESIQYLSEEIREFESEYANKIWKDYQNDKKLQKLVDFRWQAIKMFNEQKLLVIKFTIEILEREKKKAE
jgi:hypothetical protein